MPSRSPLSLSVLWLLLAAGPAAAGTLTSATWTQTVTPFPLVNGINLLISRTSAQLGATGTSTATSVGVALSLGTVVVSAFGAPSTPSDVLVGHIRVTEGGPQAITATAAMAGGTPAIPGTILLMTAAHAAMGVNQSMFMVGSVTLLQVPLNVGQAGQFTNTFIVQGVYVIATVDFYAWTPGTVQFTGLTSKYVPLPNVTAMGSFGLTPNGGGTVTLVAPSKISTDSPLVQTRSVLTVATLTLHFVPEPGTLLLLAAGAVGLTVAGSRRT